ncbi:MAG: phospholipase D-like domain-containing protein [Acidianus sp.]
MKIEYAKNIFPKIMELLNRATDEITIATGRFSEDFIEAIINRAASGVQTTIITSDKNWARWLENQKLSYKKDEENKIKRDYLKLRDKIIIYSRLRYIILVISMSIAIILLIRSSIHSLETLILYVSLGIINIIQFIYIRNTVKVEESKLNMVNLEVQKTLDELTSTRNTLAKKLNIIESNTLSFSIVIIDNKSLLLSCNLNSKNSSDIIMYEEIQKDNAIKLISYITNLGKP